VAQAWVAWLAIAMDGLAAGFWLTRAAAAAYAARLPSRAPSPVGMPPSRRARAPEGSTTGDPTMCRTRRVSSPSIPRLLLTTTLLCAAFQLSPPGLLAEPIIGFDPDPISVLHRECAPDTFSVAIVVDATPTPIQGFDVTLHFDPVVVTPVDVLEGALLTGSGSPTFFVWLNAGAVGDSVQINAAVLGGTVSGPGELAQIRFYKEMPGLSPLVWSKLDVRDDQNAPIAVTGDSGEVFIEGCSVPVEPTTWGRLKQTLHMR
jgi:hypothetical protein